MAAAVKTAREDAVIAFLAAASLASVAEHLDELAATRARWGGRLSPGERKAGRSAASAAVEAIVWEDEAALAAHRSPARRAAGTRYGGAHPLPPAGKMIRAVRRAAAALEAIGGPAALAHELAQARAEAERACPRQLAAIERVTATRPSQPKEAQR